MLRKLAAAVWLVGVLGGTYIEAKEIRTYEFVGSEPTYWRGCGECGQLGGFRASPSGTFQVELDFDQSVGTLLSIDADLLNYERLLYVSGDWQWEAADIDRKFLGENYLSRYRAPHKGVLGAAETHPLEQPVPEFAPGMLVLAGSGATLSPNGFFYSIGASFRVGMRDENAIFSFFVPMADAGEEILSARARLLSVEQMDETVTDSPPPPAPIAIELLPTGVPEPSGAVLALFALTVLLGSGWRRS